jgi:hypothetical protein
MISIARGIFLPPPQLLLSRIHHAMAPPPGYVAADVWHPDFPPQALLDSTTTSDGETVEWRKRSQAQDRPAVAAWFAVRPPVQLRPSTAS